jgi:hypothetical protein
MSPMFEHEQATHRLAGYSEKYGIFLESMAIITFVGVTVTN